MIKNELDKAKVHASYRSCDLSAALLSSDAMISRARCRSTRMGANDSGVRVTGLPVALRFLQKFNDALDVRVEPARPAGYARGTAVLHVGYNRCIQVILSY